MISSCFVNRCCVTLQDTANCCHLMLVVEGGKCPTPCKREGKLSGELFGDNISGGIRSGETFGFHINTVMELCGFDKKPLSCDDSGGRCRCCVCDVGNEGGVSRELSLSAARLRRSDGRLSVSDVICDVVVADRWRHGLGVCT